MNEIVLLYVVPKDDGGLGPHSRFGDPLTLNPSNLSPTRECGPKGVEPNVQAFDSGLRLEYITVICYESITRSTLGLGKHAVCQHTLRVPRWVWRKKKLGSDFSMSHRGRCRACCTAYYSLGWQLVRTNGPRFHPARIAGGC